MSEKKEQKNKQETKEQAASQEKKENKGAALTYKGKPLVRKDDIICYGDAKSDKYILMLQKRDANIFIAIQSTDKESTEGIVKYGQKDSLYDAFEIGEIWLNSYLKQ